MRLYYSRDLNPRVAVAVARLLAAPVIFIRASARDLHNGRSADALDAAAPGTPVPMLVEDGRTLWDTDAIACRLSGVTRADFWPTDDLAPELQSWLAWAHGFTRAAEVLLELRQAQQGLAEEFPELPAAHAAFHRFATVLDDVLARRRWLLDNRPTYADFRVATPLPFAAVAHLPVRGYANILKWHERLCGISAWTHPWPESEDADDTFRRVPAPPAGGRLKTPAVRRPVAVRDPVVHAPDGAAVAHEIETLQGPQARHARREALGIELLGFPRHE